MTSTLIEEDTQLAGVNVEHDPHCQIDHTSNYRHGVTQYDTPCSVVAVASILVTCQKASALSCQAFLDWLDKTDTGCLYCRRAVAVCWSITLL